MQLPVLLGYVLILGYVPADPQVVPDLQRRLQEAAAHPAKYAAAYGGGGGGGQDGRASPLQQAAEAPRSGSAVCRQDAEQGAAPKASGGPVKGPSGRQGNAGRAARGGVAGAAGSGGAWAPPASTLRQMAPYDAVKESAALERRINRAQVRRHERMAPRLPQKPRCSLAGLRGVLV